MKLIIGIVVGVVLIGGVAAYFLMRGGGTTEAPPTEVHIDPESRGDLSEIVSAPGQLQPKTKVTIGAKTTAMIMEIPFEEGATVKKGDIVVQLDSKDLEAQLKAAEAEHDAQAAEIVAQNAHLTGQQSQIEAAKAQVADAQRDLRRQKELLGSQDVSQSVVDEAQTKVDQLVAQLSAAESELVAEKANLTVSQHHLVGAEAEIARAKDNLSYTTITSPIGGIVTRVNAKVGEMVVSGTMNNPGTAILEVSDLSQMQVDAQIDESNIAAVHIGQKAKVRISAYQDQEFDGVVKLVAFDVADQNNGRQGGGGGSQQGRWYGAKIVVDIQGKQVPAGLSCDVDIETNVHKNVIKVPTQAVMGRAVDEFPPDAKAKPEVDKNKTLATVVFCMQGDHAALVPVTIRASDMTHTIITAGLKDGDRVITGPYKVLPTLSDGMKVKELSATTKPTTKPATESTTKPATQRIVKPQMNADAHR